jgi:hypothetical protein
MGMGVVKFNAKPILVSIWAGGILENPRRETSSRYRYSRHPGHAQGRLANEEPVHKVPAHEVPVHEEPAYEVPTHEVHAHEMPAHEVPVYEMSAYDVRL